MIVDYDTVCQLLSYDGETGKLWWKPRDITWFRDGLQSAQHNMRIWNAKNANKEAFTATDNNGYKIGRLLGKNYRAHRIIMLIANKNWPENVDHIDGCRSNNILSNLRAVSHLENTRNQKLRSTNTSGTMGVSWDKRDEVWIAYIKVGDRTRYLGSYQNKEGAIEARLEALNRFGFHENHGKKRGA